MATGVELATAWLRLVPTADGIEDGVAKSLSGVDGVAEKSGQSAGKKWSAGAKAAMLIGGAAIAAGVVKVFNTGLEELKFGEEINAQTQQLIANTGFKGSLAAINDYTLALSQVSGISEEDLQSAGNNILKFGDVSEDAYKRSVDALNNMGAAGKDVAGTSEALGKALADPAAAAGLLKRQGVLLNDEQKALIDSFTESGDKAAAQGVILDALEGTYGGMAEAAGGTLQGNLNKLQNNFENLSGEFVTALMPAITAVVGALQGVATWMTENPELVQMLAVALGVLTAAILATVAAMWLMALNPVGIIIGLIVIAVGLLIAAIVLLVMNWDQVVAFLIQVWSGFISWITGVIESFIGWWNTIWAAVGKWISDVWNNIVRAIQAAWNAVSNWVMGVVNSFLTWWQGIWATVSRVWSDIWNGVGSIVKGAWDGVVAFIRGYVNTIIGLINGIIDGINGVGDAIGISLRIPRIPLLASGGTITRSGSVIVGERGPELLHLPRGASVNPDISAGGGSFPSTVVLRVGDREFTAYVDERADGRVASASRERRTSLAAGARKV
jgi:hypothetical protein